MSETMLDSFAVKGAFCSDRFIAYLYLYPFRCRLDLSSRHAHRSSAQFSFIEIAVRVDDTAERIPVLDRLDSPEASQLDDLTEIGRAPVHAGRELRSQGISRNPNLIVP